MKRHRPTSSCHQQSINSGPPLGNAAIDWKYEMRRESQLIIPNLYLGPFQSSINLQKMKDVGITHVLCIRDHKEAHLIYPRFPDEFVYMTLDISDTIDQNLITVFPSCRDFIQNALENGGTVLVHCNGGIALSPAIVIGYLMSKYNWPYEYSLTYLQSKRYCVSPISFKIQLQEYEPIYLAQKMIEQQRLNGLDQGFRTKREMEDDIVDDGDYIRKQPPRPDQVTQIESRPLIDSDIAMDI